MRQGSGEYAAHVGLGCAEFDRLLGIVSAHPGRFRLLARAHDDYRDVRYRGSELADLRQELARLGPLLDRRDADLAGRMLAVVDHAIALEGRVEFVAD